MRSVAIALVCALWAPAGSGCGGSRGEAREPVPPPLCGADGVHKGDLILASDLDVEAAAGCLRVDGNLVLRGGGLARIDTSKLAHVTGDLVIGPAMRLTSVSGLSSLVHIGGSIRVNATLSLAGLFLAGLSHLGRDVVVKDNAELGVVSLPKLATVSGNVTVLKNRALTRLEMLGLGTIDGSLTVRGNPLLADVMVVSLKRISGAVTVSENAKLPETVVQSLRALGTAARPASDR